MTPLLERVDHWLFHRYRVDAHSLALTRVSVAALIVALVLPKWLWIADAPALAYHPPLSLAALFSTAPGYPFFVLLNVAAWILCALLAVGCWTRTVSGLLTGALVVGNSFEYAFGKIDHDILLVLLPLVGGLANWGAALSWDARRGTVSSEVRAWPLALFALAVAFGMVTTGLVKAGTGWLDPRSAAVRTHLVWSMLPTGRSTLLADLLLPLESPWFWEAADMTAVCLELSFGVAVLRRRWWLTVCGLACLFHLANSWLFSIHFSANPMAYAVFVRWAPLLRMHLPLERVVTTNATAWLFVAGTVYAGVRVLAVQMPSLEWSLWAGDVAFLMMAAMIAMGRLTGPRGVFRPCIRVDRVPAGVQSSGGRVIFFDGYCGLCNWWVDAILRADSTGVWRFAPLQTGTGAQLLTHVGLAETYTDSVVVIDGPHVYTHSTAILVALQRLGGRYSLAGLLLLIPTFVRDPLYALVARYRYSWFGRRETCRLPTAHERARFAAVDAEKTRDSVG